MFLVAVAESVVTWKVLLQKTNPQTGHKPKLPVSQPLEDFSSSPLRIYQDPKGQYIVFQPSLGRGFKYFLCSLLLGEIIQFDSLTNIFRMGWNHQLVIFRGRAVKLREVFFVQRNGFVFCRSTSGVHYLQQNLSNRWLWDFQRPRRTWEPIKTHTIHIPLSCSNP